MARFPLLALLCLTGSKSERIVPEVEDVLLSSSVSPVLSVTSKPEQNLAISPRNTSIAGVDHLETLSRVKDQKSAAGLRQRAADLVAASEVFTHEPHMLETSPSGLSQVSESVASLPIMPPQPDVNSSQLAVLNALWDPCNATDDTPTEDELDQRLENAVEHLGTSSDRLLAEAKALRAEITTTTTITTFDRRRGRSARVARLVAEARRDSRDE
eukprot:TRINITY_DN46293_c0_g1_i1.p1 TRINITY_DN46293_c0_g1~~TRINITY_DN46293_c0_g1_i1.p1  ORF type:complete len:214 (+),score=16.16 TRINITY_DN46293_c0_g1_i1:38-679(+)